MHPDSGSRQPWEPPRQRAQTTGRQAAAPVARPAKASLVAAITDDGLPKPRGPIKRAVGQETPPTLQGGTDAPVNVPLVSGLSAQGSPGATEASQGSRISWVVWRGPADVRFEPGSAQVRQGRAVTTATFTKPGEYELRGTATDGLANTSRTVKVVVQ